MRNNSGGGESDTAEGCRKAKGPFIEGECLIVQRDFQRGGGSDSRSNSGTGVKAKQPEITL